MRASSDYKITNTIIIRGLIHELKVGILLGIACAAVTFALGFLFHANSATLGLFVGISLLITMVVGLLVGMVTPWIFQKMGIDPAHASGPLISSLLDVFTFTIYLSIVHNFLSQITPTT
jgi:magnesium transporter